MKIVLALMLAICSISAFAAQNVKGFTRKDGTYVVPHQRSNPNSIRSDNYGARGNTNPYTGKQGSQRHEYTNPPAYNKGRSKY